MWTLVVPGDMTNPQSGFKSKSNRDTDKKLVHLAPPTAHTIWRLEFIYNTRQDIYVLHESVLFVINASNLAIEWNAFL